MDLCALAGLRPGAAIIEIMADNGEMARLPQLEEFCAKHKLLLCTIADLIQYRLQQDTLIRRIESLPIDTPQGRFDLRVYETVGDTLLHVAACAAAAWEMDAGTKKAVAHASRCWCACTRIWGCVSGGGDGFGAGITAVAGNDSGCREGAVIGLRQESRGLAALLPTV